ncbi:MAG: hypothetical protein V3R93_06600, partial [Candidatus Hydrothermarchaeaceae archaeon]
MREIRETLTAEQLAASIKKAAKEILIDINKRKDPGFDVPTRGSDNIAYDEKKDVIYLGEKESRRSFHNTGTVNTFTQTLFTLSVLLESAERKKHLTKREVYYQDPELFNKDQNASDNVIEDLAVIMGVTRPCLRVVA